MDEPRPAVLFVDDDPRALQSLRRLFEDKGWTLHFATSGAKGLELPARTPMDLVVSDFRMPGMDGLAFLREVQRLYPDTVRLFLSGSADRDNLVAALADGSAQAILAKPWKGDELRRAIEKSLGMSRAQKGSGPDLQTLINNIPSLPPLPEIYHEIQACFSNRENLHFNDIGRILEQDVGLTASLLRWANSPIFGQMSKVDTVRRAIVVLGLDVVEGLVLSKAVANSLHLESCKHFSMDRFQSHSMSVGVLARLLLRGYGETIPRELLDQGFTAGLMHDMGKMILARYFPIHLEQAYALAAREKSLMYEAERTLLGYAHDEIGGYLAAWWNLPEFIVQAVRWHHDPVKAEGGRLIPAAVHVADALAQVFGLGLPGNHRPPEVDSDRWERFDLNPSYLSELQREVRQSLPAMGFP